MFGVNHCAAWNGRYTRHVKAVTMQQCDVMSNKIAVKGAVFSVWNAHVFVAAGMFACFEFPVVR